MLLLKFAFVTETISHKFSRGTKPKIFAKIIAKLVYYTEEEIKRFIPGVKNTQKKKIKRNERDFERFTDITFPCHDFFE